MRIGQNQEKKSVPLADAIRPARHRVECTGIDGAADAYLITRIMAVDDAPAVVLTAGFQQADRLLNDLAFFLAGSGRPGPELFPAYNVSPYKPFAYHNATAAARIRLLYRMARGDMPPVMIIPIEALLQRLIPRRDLCDFAEIIMTGEGLDVPALGEKLSSGGYTRTAIVEEPGDFCQRGGILDVFSPLYADPVRLELFGDTVETMHFFSPVSQRRGAPVDEIVLPPAGEAMVNKAYRGKIIAAVKKLSAELDLPLSVSRDIIDGITTDGTCDGIEGLMPLLYDHLSTFFDYLPPTSRFILVSPEEIENAAAAQRQRLLEAYLSTRDEKKICLPPETLFLDWETVETNIREKRTIRLRMLPIADGEASGADRNEHIHFDVRAINRLPLALKYNPDTDKPMAPLAEWLAANRREGQTTVIVCGNQSRADRIQALLRPYGIKPVHRDHFPDQTEVGTVYLVPGQVSSGFASTDFGLSLVSETDIFGGGRRRAVRRATSRSEILQLEELKKGDLVVHADHGIGRYDGIRKIKVDKVYGDFLLIRYQDDDRLYLSVDRMDMVKKYIGVDDVVPELDKMGGKSWQRVKSRAKKEAEKIAKELLALYARRKAHEGYSFSPADGYFDEFEARFPYEETPDQLKVIDDVLADMEASKPMDRLVCGDVGFGKTEIAMRAAFKAVSDGKQVAVLVPTTVLAEQHRATFTRRFSDYPARIACLNRFRSAAEQKEIVRDLGEGKIDIVIGTHRLLSKDVAFKDIGLLILDEEQRFGVKHKEKLTSMRSTVDVLSLTATPIPRTLHLSLIGVRDISVINTPPEDRLAVKTYVSEYDDGIVKAAIRRELERGGQIYFVHNNINKIWFIADHLQKLVPEVRIGVAHGQMDGDKLEQEMMKFINRQIDMLVCTRIIESGLDIPLANTIFVNRADRFGLSQIYQLRGRVGRSDEQAYAYLFIPKDSALGKDARKRLKVLMEHSDLGSGFQIAMSDLQIRGGGSILGVSQSGHIAAVGYDMFLELMERTVAELKGEPVSDPLDAEINIPLSAFIADTYIPVMDQRLAIYRRLARASSAGDIAAVKAEMLDRYGKMPTETENLLLKILLKVFSVKAGVKRLDLSDTSLVLQLSPERSADWRKIQNLFAEKKLPFEITTQTAFKITLRQKNQRNGVVFARNLLKDMALCVNNK